LLPERALGSWDPGPLKLPAALVPKTSFEDRSRTRFFYEVQWGDTLDALATGFSLSAADLALWNDLDVQAKLRGGMMLQMFLSDEASSGNLSLIKADEVEIVHERPREVSKASSKKGQAKNSRVHIVKKGDTLANIAKRHKLKLEDVERWNPKLRKKKFLQLGDEVRLNP
jgi:membrane-bound lytic murein transglycosylase D